MREAQLESVLDVGNNYAADAARLGAQLAAKDARIAELEKLTADYDKHCSQLNSESFADLDRAEALEARLADARRMVESLPCTCTHWGVMSSPPQPTDHVELRKCARCAYLAEGTEGRE